MRFESTIASGPRLGDRPHGTPPRGRGAKSPQATLATLCEAGSCSSSVVALPPASPRCVAGLAQDSTQRGTNRAQPCPLFHMDRKFMLPSPGRLGGLTEPGLAHISVDARSSRASAFRWSSSAAPPWLPPAPPQPPPPRAAALAGAPSPLLLGADVLPQPLLAPDAPHPLVRTVEPAGESGCGHPPTHVRLLSLGLLSAAQPGEAPGCLSFNESAYSGMWSKYNPVIGDPVLCAHSIAVGPSMARTV